MWWILREEWPWIPMSEEDTRRMLKIQNKLMLRNKDPKVKAMWEYGERNIDILVEDLTKKYNEKSNGVLDNDWNW